MDEDRIELLRGLVEASYDRLVKEIIADIKALPESCRQSGEDSVLADVWEEFKYQIQRQDSVLFESYEDTIRSMCTRRISTLDSVSQGLLWLWSDGYWDWESEDPEIPFGDPLEEALEEELYQRVINLAADEELANDPDLKDDEELEGNEKLVDDGEYD